MNTVVFMEWFNKLLDSLDRPSLIVLDNASYHNAIAEGTKSPVMKDRKAVMVAWLQEKQIPFTGNMTKPELYEIIKQKKPAKVYETDIRAANAGHVVLRTPPRQCELNAIELVWAKVKWPEKNTGMKMKEVMTLTREALVHVTQDDWANVVRHTVQVEDSHWETDGLQDEIHPFIINIASDDESSDEESSDESDNDHDAHI